MISAELAVRDQQGMQAVVGCDWRGPTRPGIKNDLPAPTITTDHTLELEMLCGDLDLTK